jgi:hypothetical protein
MDDIYSENGWHLLREWVTFTQRMGYIYSENGWHLLREWVTFTQRMSDIYSENGWHLLREWVTFTLVKSNIVYFNTTEYKYILTLHLIVYTIGANVSFSTTGASWDRPVTMVGSTKYPSLSIC